ncbi:3-dehydroquinate synthase II [Halorussus caseinilyticus]|uniref:3-dehydroquinate synthase II n=1 Tax=Halorussus caseinilyticus TaxID=3034025 RepID=A0ABD5WJ97_9EURY
MERERNKEFWLDARRFLDGNSSVVAAGFNTLVDALLVTPDQREQFSLPARTAAAIEVENVDDLATVEDGAIVVSSHAECLRRASEQGFRTGYLPPTNGEFDPESALDLLEGSAEYGIFNGEAPEGFEDELGGAATILRHASSAEAAKSRADGSAASGGALLSTRDAQDVYDVGNALLREYRGEIAVEPLEITRVEQVGVGERSCVDVTSLFSKDEGMVVGSTGDGGLFVCSEAHSPPNMSPRPFRVNAGSVHAYVNVADDEIEYLTELSTGDEVLCVDKDGNTRPASIGRKKTETRPLLLVEATAGDRTVEAVLQDHCHVRLMGSDGEPLNVTEASVGDEVLGHVRTAGDAGD